MVTRHVDPQKTFKNCQLYFFSIFLLSPPENEHGLLLEQSWIPISKNTCQTWPSGSIGADEYVDNKAYAYIISNADSILNSKRSTESRAK